MDVGMMGHRRTPRVQDCGDADLGTQVLRVSGDGPHGRGGGLEEETVDHRLVLVGDDSDLSGQREDDMKIGNLQQLGLAVLHPGKCLTALALGTVTVAAAAVRDHRVAALRVLAARDVATERGGAAGLDGAHDLQLCVAHVAAVGSTPSGPEVAKYIRDFQSGKLHELSPATSAGPSRAVGT